MESVLPLIYHFVETIHVFIPLLAIFTCVIIFACSSGTIKYSQPPQDYLNEIGNRRLETVNRKRIKKVVGQQPPKAVKSSGNLPEKQLGSKSGTPEMIEEVPESTTQPKSSKKQRRGELIAARSRIVNTDPMTSDDWIIVSGMKHKKQSIFPKKVEAPKAELYTTTAYAPLADAIVDSNFSVVPSFGSIESDFLVTKDARSKKPDVKRKLSGRRPSILSGDKQAESNDKDFVVVEGRRRRIVRRAD